MDALRNNPVASLIVVLIAIAGAIVTIINPDTLPFDNYVQDVMIGAGLLAVGRGVQDGLKNQRLGSGDGTSRRGV